MDVCHHRWHPNGYWCDAVDVDGEPWRKSALFPPVFFGKMFSPTPMGSATRG